MEGKPHNQYFFFSSLEHIFGFHLSAPLLDTRPIYQIASSFYNHEQ